MQYTLQNSISLEGIGLHSGKTVTMRLCPAVKNSGVVFKRTDMTKGKNIIPARFDAVVDTRLCTVIANEHGASVGTIEHVMSALYGLGVDNAIVEIDAPEVPVMDGSAMPFVELIQQVGLKEQDAPRKILKILKDVTYEEDGKSVTLSPSEVTSFEGVIDFDTDLIGRQSYSAQMLNGNFVHDIAAARTFCLEKEVEAMKAAGLALGGSLDNAIVFGEESVLNKDGLRFEDECIRHKLLDAMGDIFLGGRIQGAYKGQKPGHYMNNMILKTLFADETAYEWVLEGQNIPSFTQTQYDAQENASA